MAHARYKPLYRLFESHRRCGKKKIALQKQKRSSSTSIDISPQTMAKKSYCHTAFCLRRSPRQHDNAYDMVRFLVDGCACSSVDRASASGAEGHRFKSCQAHHKTKHKHDVGSPAFLYHRRDAQKGQQQGRRREQTGGVPLRYVEDLLRRERS